LVHTPSILTPGGMPVQNNPAQQGARPDPQIPPLPLHVAEREFVAKKVMLRRT
jgi:hypothetical protein